MSKIRLILPLLLFTTLQACNYSCQQNFINPVFVGFAFSDVDTFVIREYQPNSNFTKLVDTVLVIPGPAYYSQSNDTIFAFLELGPPEPLHSGYDWQIYIPSKHRTITLTDIVDDPTEGESDACFDPISSFKQDGQVIVLPVVKGTEWSSGGNFAYINNN